MVKAGETETKKKAKCFKDKRKNMQRLGGGRGGLSLEAFANAKTKTNTYNPAIISISYDTGELNYCFYRKNNSADSKSMV
uniref:Uncharacterized protein n=1 Tax=Solanum tuberosum TaxID=4113 RepID=M1C813_SOLTU